MIGVFGPLAILMSLAQASALPATDNFILSFSRNYGRSVFSQCRLDIVVYESRGGASLWCDSTASDSKGRPVPDVNARQELTADDTKRLTATLRSARLFEGGHVGTDSRAGDGIFETLKLTLDGRTVVLVTSGNPAFDTPGARKQLLSMLNDIEKRLRENARQ
jgi:hypothetical protein